MSQKRPPETLTRREVAARLRCSVPMVYRLDGDKLHPLRVGPRVWYPMDEVCKLAETFRVRSYRPRVPTRVDRLEAGELAAKVYELALQGLDETAIVIATKGDPDSVHRYMKRARTTFEEREAEIRAERRAVEERVAERVRERQRKRDEHFARRAAEQARLAPPVTPSRFQPVRRAPAAAPAPVPAPEEESA